MKYNSIVNNLFLALLASSIISGEGYAMDPCGAASDHVAVASAVRRVAEDFSSFGYYVQNYWNPEVKRLVEAKTPQGLASVSQSLLRHFQVGQLGYLPLDTDAEGSLTEDRILKAFRSGEFKTKKNPASLPLNWTALGYFSLNSARLQSLVKRTEGGLTNIIVALATHFVDWGSDLSYGAESDAQEATGSGADAASVAGPADLRDVLRSIPRFSEEEIRAVGRGGIGSEDECVFLSNMIFADWKVSEADAVRAEELRAKIQRITEEQGSAAPADERDALRVVTPFTEQDIGELLDVGLPDRELELILAASGKNWHVTSVVAEQLEEIRHRLSHRPPAAEAEPAAPPVALRAWAQADMAGFLTPYLTPEQLGDLSRVEPERQYLATVLRYPLYDDRDHFQAVLTNLVQRLSEETPDGLLTILLDFDNTVRARNENRAFIDPRITQEERDNGLQLVSADWPVILDELRRAGHRVILLTGREGQEATDLPLDLASSGLVQGTHYDDVVITNGNTKGPDARSLHGDRPTLFIDDMLVNSVGVGYALTEERVPVIGLHIGTQEDFEDRSNVEFLATF